MLQRLRDCWSRIRKLRPETIETDTDDLTAFTARYRQEATARVWARVARMLDAPASRHELPPADVQIAMQHWVRTHRQPEEVFTDEQLRAWSRQHGFRPPLDREAVPDA